MTESDHEARARTLVGTRFRPQGRGRHGLDCVGVVLATFAIADDDVRRDYRLRGEHEADLRGELGRILRKVRKGRTGDVMLMRVAPDQLHLAVRTQTGFVHADAGIGRVVETPGEPIWPVLAIYRSRRKER